MRAADTPCITCSALLLAAANKRPATTIINFCISWLQRAGLAVAGHDGYMASTREQANSNWPYQS